MITKKEIGDAIRATRQSKKMTTLELSTKASIPQSSISDWENGKTQPTAGALFRLCDALDITPTQLLRNNNPKIRAIKIPVIGSIACGEPIMADQQVEFYVDAFDGIRADFALWAKGDSMIDARINDGDLVFIRKQEMVENGEIAAVLIGNEATLKRVYYDKQSNILTLTPANPKYPPLVFANNELENIKILGKAVAFQSLVK